VLLLLALSVERRAGRVGLYGEGVTLKVTYSDMKTITRSRMVPPTRTAMEIYEEAAGLLSQVPHRPVRLIGAGIYHLTGTYRRQLRFEDLMPEAAARKESLLKEALAGLQRHYGLDFAGNLNRIFQGETLFKTVEYMRRHA
jgi:DNA polymerase-4/DNA polymerase IV (DinB-like DNA polymerase)